MLNLLNDIAYSIFRVQNLRARIAVLTEELHTEELKIASYSQQCITLREEELAKKKQPPHRG